MNAAAFKAWCMVKPGSVRTYKRRPLILGILNITPDSFSDGGQFLHPEHALRHALEMIAAGADLIDIGGESTRPGSPPVTEQEELDRVLPVIERLRAHSDIGISIDTTKATVMQAAVSAGATMINDINALRTSGALAMAALLEVPVCLMHMQGTPQTMQVNPSYSQDIIDAIQLFFEERINACLQAGILREHLILDPGFGFGKTVAHNLQIIQRLCAFQSHELPILIGVSRKSTLGQVLNKAVSERLAGGIATEVFAALHGATIIRTHDVNATWQACTMLDAILRVPLFNEKDQRG